MIGHAHVGTMMISCRATCHNCDILNSVATLQPSSNDTTFAHASSFWMSPPLGTYHQGSRLLKGNNRDFVLAPLYKIVEDRYTVYFNNMLQ
jgi:7,8-dihydro-6-hydroxymethylpterin-pyrophosphokinase